MNDTLYNTKNLLEDKVFVHAWMKNCLLLLIRFPSTTHLERFLQRKRLESLVVKEIFRCARSLERKGMLNYLWKELLWRQRFNAWMKINLDSVCYLLRLILQILLSLNFTRNFRGIHYFVKDFYRVQGKPGSNGKIIIDLINLKELLRITTTL